MNIGPTNTVAELALNNPASTRVLEKYGIDYCCGGRRPIGEACREAGVDFDTLVGMIEAAPAGGADWRQEPVSRLIDHILETHHVFTRSELARITGLLDKVCNRHGENHPELLNLRERFEVLRGDLIPHMLKEEQVLFPYLRQLEHAVDTGARPPEPFFMTVRNPVRMMEREHDTAGDLLRELRALTHDYTPPEDACMSYKALFNALSDIEADLHRHIHLENNVLFPRAVEMESSINPDERTVPGGSGGCFGV
ncbi:MAG: iron-sulfur cluster repair di-iron protein [Blastocatellales bacterium]